MEFGTRVRVTPGDFYTRSFPDLAARISELPGVMVEATDEYGNAVVMFEEPFFEPSYDEDDYQDPTQPVDGRFHSRVFYTHADDTVEAL